MKAASWLYLSVCLGVSSTAQGAVILSVLTTPAQIAAFQAGATVQTFESVAGLPGFNIPNFNTNVSTAGLTGAGLALLQFRAGGTGFIPTSGGVSPTGVFNLTGGLTGASSGTHVLAPLDMNQNTCFDPAAGCFMAFELLFEQGIQKVGFYMNRAGTILLENDTSVTVDTSTNPPTIMRAGANNIFTQANIPAGFVTLTSTSANINGVSILMGTGPMFIDDLTYARSAATTATPEPASITLAGIALGALILSRKFSSRRSLT